MQGAPGEHLLAAQTEARRARLTCARVCLRALAESAANERQFQRELDAMAQDFTEPALRQLLRDELGPRADELSSAVALAVATAQSERLTPDSQSLAAAAPSRDDVLPASALPLDAPPEQLVKHCTQRGGTAVLDCLAQLPGTTPGRSGAADDVVARLASTGDAVEHHASLLAKARGVASDGALAPLEHRLRRACGLRVAQVKALTERGEGLRAAAQLVPCRAVMPADAAVVFAAAAAELERKALAAEGRGLRSSAQLSRAVAAWLLGATPKPIRFEAGAWDTSRVQCHRPLPAPPEPVPLGLKLRLVGRCVVRDAKPSEATAAPEGTFDQERALKSEGFQGEVLAACGDELLRLGVDVRDVLLDGPWGGQENGVDGALMSRLQTVLAEAQAKCRAVRERAQTGACARLGSADAESMEQLFVELGVALGRWAPCFADAYRARTGVELSPAWLR